MAGPAAITFVVVTDEPTSLTDAYAFIKLARAANPSADMRVVVNMAANTSDGQKTYDTIRKACESFLHYTPPLAASCDVTRKYGMPFVHKPRFWVRSPTTEAAERCGSHRPALDVIGRCTPMAEIPRSYSHGLIIVDICCQRIISRCAYYRGCGQRAEYSTKFSAAN